ncbi:MAG: 3-isopropylmalate dehydratase large subunit, partial [Deinococcus sp.]|nr:3-isopropylmalate dehydratase large subunit [Deinococcus sp.]
MRGQTLAEKILSHAAGKAVRAGDLVVVDCALVMIVDSVAQSVIKTLTKELGVTKFPHPERITFVIDHVAPAPTVQVAEGQAELRRYARQHNLQVFEVGRGICHQV